MNASADLRKALDSLEHFTTLVGSQVDSTDPEFERLLDGYLDNRRSLARQFSTLAQRFLLQGETLLNATQKRIEQRMRDLFADRIPESYLVLRGYKGVHPILLEYLAQHVGEPVRASKLRVLTADQTHTERRVRDLRGLGFHVEWKRVAGEDQYVLNSREPDLDAAAGLQVHRNISADKKLSSQQRVTLLSSLEQRG
ncbi:MAG: hypothetical protein HY820_28530 [Acidobacteria bacterium]|nr:hypothetical protein [Acidobacteriota bacterium]